MMCKIYTIASTNNENNMKNRANSNLPPLPPSTSPAISFDIDSFIGDLFASIPEELAHHCLATMRAACKLSKLIAASAEKSGINDHKMIRKIICSLFLFPEQQQISYIPGSLSGLDRQQQLLRIQINLALKALRQCDLDMIIRQFASTTAQHTFNEVALLIKKAVSEKLDLKFLPDWLAILKFLHDTDLVETYLIQLEAALQEHVKHSHVKDLLVLQNDETYVMGKNEKNHYQRHKILSTYLYQWAKESGFKLNAKIIKGIDEDVFFSLLTSHTFFKDTASNVGNDHGVWSHALQWHFIIKHYEKTKFLQHSPLDVYASFSTLPPESERTNSVTIWMLVLDKFNTNTFSSPEYITQTIGHRLKYHQWPLLAQSVTRSQDKLLWKFGSVAGYAKYQEVKHAAEQVDGVVRRKFTT
jgi:hypothetical protein